MNFKESDMDDIFFELLITDQEFYESFIRIWFDAQKIRAATPHVQEDSKPRKWEIVLKFRGGPPPKPVIIKDHPRKKKDWRPVLEWHLRNPEISLKELAMLLNMHEDLNCSYGRLRQKMAEFKGEFTG